MNGNKKSPHETYRDMAEEAISLQILDIIEQDQKVSQNKITAKTGLAAGLVHSYMKKVIGKGWVKAKQVSARRWLYYLTPEGFVEKGRLTIKYLTVTLERYRGMQGLIREHLADCQANGYQRLVIAGSGELAEIALLNIQTMDGLEVVAVVSASPDNEKLLNNEIFAFEELSKLSYDKIVVCDVAFLAWWHENNYEKSNDFILLEGQAGG